MEERTCYAINQNENNGNTAITVEASLQARIGRNATWINSNVSPKKMHKFRKVRITFCRNRKNYIGRAVIEAKAITRSIAKGAKIFLATSMAKRNEVQQKEETIVFDFPDGLPEVVELFVGVDVTKNEISTKAIYNVSVCLKIEDYYERCLFNLETMPIKSHKYESSKPVKAEAEKNVDAIVTSITMKELEPPVRNCSYINDTDLTFLNEYGIENNNCSLNDVFYSDVLDDTLFVNDLPLLDNLW